MHFQNFVGIVALVHALVLTSCSSVHATSNQDKYHDIRSLILEYLGRSDVNPMHIGGFDGASTIGEYRIEMPLTLDEFNRGHLYTVAEFSKAETGGGEGVEIIANEPFDEVDGFGPGQYTHKIYHLASKVPRWVRILAPRGSLEFKEESWNSFPYTKTIITNPEYMKDKFALQIETWNEVGKCKIENVHHNLSPEQLAKRSVELIDLTGEHVRPSDYKEEFDPTKCTSEKTGRGPLIPDQWQSEPDPVMCSYKLVSTEFVWFGLQSRVEKFILSEERRLFLNFHRQMYCDLDDYVDLSMDDIRKIEEETKTELVQLRATGDVTGMRAD